MAVVSSGITLSKAGSEVTYDVQDVTVPGISRESIKTTHQTTNGGAMGSAHTFVSSGLADAGELEFVIQFDPTDLTGLFTDSVRWIITFGNESGDPKLYFDGFVTAYKPTGTLDSLMTATITVKVAGKISNSTF